MNKKFLLMNHPVTSSQGITNDPMLTFLEVPIHMMCGNKSAICMVDNIIEINRQNMSISINILSRILLNMGLSVLTISSLQ